MSTQDVVIGILSLVVGAVFCFRGAVAMRYVIALWGAFVGFMLGAGIVAGVDDTGFLRTVLAWIVACVGAIAVGTLAYAFYEIAVIVAMASIGFTLGTTVMVAFGVSWSWVVILVGVVVGAALAVITLAANLPALLLLVLSSFGGATAIITGVMLLVNSVDSSEFTRTDAIEKIHTSWGWWVAYIALAVAGMVSQARDLSSASESMHDQWRSARAG